MGFTRRQALKAAALAVVVVGSFATAIAAHRPEGAEHFGAASLLPSCAAIALCFLTRQALLSLFFGVLIGAWMLEGRAVGGFLRALDTHLLDAVSDRTHAGILAFTLLIGGMVGVMLRMGGLPAIARALAARTRGPRGAQLAAWVTGLIVFFDDYANTLIVGPTLRPLTDRWRVSREKLAYIVDSTAAPVAGLALISTWVGTELSLIRDGLAQIGLQANPYDVFIQTLPFRFYAVYAIVMVLLTAWMMRDLGTMAQAERRARLTGKLIADGATPMADPERELGAARFEDAGGNVWSAVVPLSVLLVGALWGMWYNGEGPEQSFTWQGLQAAFGAADSTIALLWASAAGGIVAVAMAVGGRRLTTAQAMDAWLAGARSLLITVFILALAWALGNVTEKAGAAAYLIDLTARAIPAWALPSLVFLLCCAISFATGTSWGTMAIMMPLVIPMANVFSRGTLDECMLATIGAVLTGAIFGDHCSPISDTTIMSSMASSCDHMDHVRTQMPYALVVAAASLALGYLPSGLGVSPWVTNALVLAALVLVLRVFGRRVPEDSCSSAADAAAPRSAA